MTDNVTSELILEHLKAIRADIHQLKTDQAIMRETLSGQAGILSGQSSVLAAHSLQLTDLAARLERIERRLELREDA